MQSFEEYLRRIIRTMRSRGLIISVWVIIKIITELSPDFREGRIGSVRKKIYKFMGRSNFFLEESMIFISSVMY